MRYNSLIFALLILSCNPAPQPPKPSSEQQRALDAFQLMAGFNIELVAAEPLVTDPVAMEIDERGQMYVVEMPGYPLDLSKSGRIKLLKDTNADGYPDTAVVFAENLTLPTGVMRWRKGILVTDAPDVWYLEDTNGDDKADVRKKLLTGFARSNPQHNLNSPVFGPDNWIYLAHEGAVTPFVYQKEFGDKGSVIRFPDSPNAPTLPQNADGRNVRFRPDTRELETRSGETQFGQTFDAWGHHFMTANANHLFHEVLAARYVRRNPNLLIPDATQNIPDHGDAAEVYPATENPNHQLLTDRGVITSSCGVTWYLGGAFGDKFQNVTFIAEPSHNLVHADVIRDQGASFVASRLVEKREFLTSKDSWFRPVNFYVGPDGALYVVDYYRQSIEHPEWMSDEMVKSGTLYNGKDKGRIYRIVPKKGLPMDWLNRLNLADLSDEELVQKLDHQNGWFRRTAQRLLFQRASAKTILPLKNLIAQTTRPEAKVPALWLLDALNAADEETLRRCLQDKAAGVRENAIRIAERVIAGGNPALTADLLDLQNDPSAKVRYQLLCALGDLRDPRTDQVRVAILKKDIEDKWTGLAALTSATGREMQLYEQADRVFGGQPSHAKQEFFTYLGATIANKGNAAEVGRIFSSKTSWTKIAALNGMAKLWQHKGLTVPLTDTDRLALLPDFTKSAPSAFLQTQLDVLRVIGLPATSAVKAQAQRAAVLAADPQQAVGLRTAAVQLLALYNPRAYASVLERLAVAGDDEQIRLVAFASMSRVSGRQACAFALREWPKFTPAMKHEAIDVFLHQPDQIQHLLTAIDRKVVRHDQLQWHQKVGLMNYYDTRIRTQARRVLAVDENRHVVVQQYQAALTSRGNSDRGKVVFARVCSACHQLGGQGGRAFGPDLATVRNRNPHNLLTEILHPNHSIADGYDYCTITQRNGQQTSGILAKETASTVTIRLAGGDIPDRVIPRSDVLRIDKSTTSAMPVGLENSISVTEMADLVAFIRNQ
ncbi:MAG: c-type cytochrome [Cytophagaceae bacterium]|nr:c-type cytochrome [Cytophagaceae bacterium]